MTKITRSFPQCLHYTQRHFGFCRSLPRIFLALTCFYQPIPSAHHCEGPAARNKQLRKSQWLNFITWGFAQHSNSICICKCNGKEMGRNEKQRSCYRHKPQCSGSSDKVENMVKVSWANRWAGWTDFFLKWTQILNWCELSFNPAAWGKALSIPRTADVHAWDTNLVKKSLIIKPNISIVGFSKCPLLTFQCGGGWEARTQDMVRASSCALVWERLWTTERFRL